MKIYVTKLKRSKFCLCLKSNFGFHLWNPFTAEIRQKYEITIELVVSIDSQTYTREVYT